MSNCDKCGAPVGWSKGIISMSGRFRFSDEYKMLEAFQAFANNRWSLIWEEWPDGKVFWVVKDVKSETVADGSTPTEAIMNALGNVEKFRHPSAPEVECIHERGVLKRFASKVARFLGTFI